MSQVGSIMKGTPTLYEVPGLKKCQPWSMPSLASIPHARGRVTHIPPINRVPPEVLALVFLHSTPIQLLDATPDTRSMPVVLSHVCSYWRVVAIDLPQLWLWLSLTSCTIKHKHYRMEFAQAYATRAKGMGMVIHYRDAEADPDLSIEYFDAIIKGRGAKVARAEERCYCALDFIIARIRDIRVLELFIGHASARRLSSISPGSPVSLSNLVVRFLEGGAQTRVLANLYASSPRINSLTWGSDVGICTVPAPLYVPWTQLATAHLYDSPITNEAFLDMMASGHNLKDVSVRLTCDTLPLVPFQRRITQNALESLTIRSDDPLDDAFDNIHFPALRQLFLWSNSQNVHAWPCKDVRSLCHFLAGVSPGLDSFRLTPGGNITEDALIRIISLPQMATLTSLDVRLSLGISDLLFTRLTPLSGRTPLLPYLQELLVAKCATDDGTVGRLVRLRQGHAYPLHYLDIAYVRQQEGMHGEDIAEFRKLQGYGYYVRHSY